MLRPMSIILVNLYQNFSTIVCTWWKNWTVLTYLSHLSLSKTYHRNTWQFCVKSIHVFAIYVLKPIGKFFRLKHQVLLSFFRTWLGQYICKGKESCTFESILKAANFDTVFSDSLSLKVTMTPRTRGSFGCTQT